MGNYQSTTHVQELSMEKESLSFVQELEMDESESFSFVQELSMEEESSSFVQELEMDELDSLLFVEELNIDNVKKKKERREIADFKELQQLQKLIQKILKGSEDKDEQLNVSLSLSSGIFNIVETMSKEEISKDIQALENLYNSQIIQEWEYIKRKHQLQEALSNAKSELDLPCVDYNNQKKNIENKNRNVRVFISSTFRDMQDEREVMLKNVFPQLQKFCTERGVFLTQVDLRWGITTEQSDQGDTINICLKEVDNCRPYFIGLLGNRYGWAQPRDQSDKLLKRTFEKASIYFPWVIKYQDRSVTELEIRHAVLNGTPETVQTASNALFYLRKTEGGIGSAVGIDREKLEKLKEEIVASGLNVTYYTNPNQIAQDMLENMKNLIDRDFPLSEIPSPLEKEKMTHDAFQEIRSRVYIGGEQYFEFIDAYSSDPIVVVGESGSGKSALIANWTKRHEISQPGRLVVAHYIGSTSSSSELSGLLRRILWEISRYFRINKKIPTDPKEMARELPDWLDQASQRGGMTLVLDALNQLSDIDSHNLLWLPRHFPNNVKIVISTLAGVCLDNLTARKWKQLRIKPLSIEEMKEFVESFMTQYGKSLTSSQLQLIVNSNQCKNPLFLKTLLEELRVFGEFEQLDSKINYYLTADTPAKLFELVFERLENDYEKERPRLVGDALGLLWGSRKGLTETELLELLKVSPGIWGPVHLSLEESLLSKSGYFTFFHDYMRQAVNTRYIQAKGQRYYRKLLIDYFDSLDVLDEFSSQRRVEEVPYQYRELSEWNNLSNFLSKPSNFKVLLKSEMKVDLYKFWRETAQHVTNMEEKFLQELSDANIVSQGFSIELITEIGEFFQDIASYSTAEHIFKKVELLAQKSGNQALVANSLALLAKLSDKMGKYNEASQLYEKSLKNLNQEKNPDQKQFSNIMNNLGELYRKQGKYKQSEELFFRGLDIRKRIYGDFSEPIAQTFNQLGILKQSMGTYTEAEDYFKKSLQIRETLFSSNHPSIALSLKDLADLYLLCSKFEEAYTMFEKVLSIYESIWGPFHPSFAETIQSMASTRLQQGRYRESEQLFEKALKLQRKVLGNSHPDVALTLNEFAGLYLRQNMFDKAEQLFQESLNIRREVLGENHNDYASSLNNMGSLYQKKGSYSTALEYFGQGLKILKNIYGEKHIDIATNLLNTAGVYQQQSRYQEAVPLYTNALLILTEILGINHAYVAVTFNDMAILLFNLECWEEAEIMYKTALKCYDQVFGRVHPGTAQVLYNFGAFYRFKGDYNNALLYYNRALDVFIQTLGEEDPKTIKTKETLAKVTNSKGVDPKSSKNVKELI